MTRVIWTYLRGLSLTILLLSTFTRVVTGEISQKKFRFFGLLISCDCIFRVLEFGASGVDEATGFEDPDFLTGNSLVIELGVLLIISWDSGDIPPTDEVIFLLTVSVKNVNKMLVQ